jgi:hypothetical protein
MEVIDHDRRVGQQARCADRRRVNGGRVDRDELHPGWELVAALR